MHCTVGVTYVCRSFLDITLSDALAPLVSLGTVNYCLSTPHRHSSANPTSKHLQFGCMLIRRHELELVSGLFLVDTAATARQSKRTRQLTSELVCLFHLHRLQVSRRKRSSPKSVDTQVGQFPRPPSPFSFFRFSAQSKAWMHNHFRLLCSNNGSQPYDF